MSIDVLSKRLAHIEGRRGSGRITETCNLANHPAEVVGEAVRNWRAWVAAGRASRVGSTLILRATRLTATEWSAHHAPRGSLH